MFRKSLYFSWIENIKIETLMERGDYENGS
jgi:hypothetical protein